MSVFSGVWPALITPFSNGKIDEDAFKRPIEYQIAGGVSGIVACGTTGESATTSRDERLRLIELSVKFADGRVPVMAGTGASDTAASVEFTEDASSLGLALP